jgi:hypothetical protein
MLIHPHFADRRHDDLIAAAEAPGRHRSRETASPAREPSQGAADGDGNGGLVLDALGRLAM